MLSFWVYMFSVGRCKVEMLVKLDQDVSSANYSEITVFIYTVGGGRAAEDLVSEYIVCVEQQPYRCII